MIYKFTYDYSVLGVVVAADIEGEAEIDIDADGDWTVESIRLHAAAHGDNRLVTLPIDHPLCVDVKLWLLTHQVSEIDEEVGSRLPRNDPHREHRLTKREMV